MDHAPDSLDAFRTCAAYYEILFDSKARLEHEGPLLRYVYDAAPGKRVADLACGTGPHALFFAELGARVTAYDLSPDMIAHARARRPHPSITYVQQDMREVNGGPWDLVLCLGNSLCLLPSHEDAASLFSRVRSQLAPGGLFLTQTLNYAADDAQEARHRVVRKRQNGVDVVAVKNLVPHGDYTLLSLAFYAFSGAERFAVAESAVLVHLDRVDLEHFAAQARLERVELWGGFDRSGFEAAESTDVIGLFRYT